MRVGGRLGRPNKDNNAAAPGSGATRTGAALRHEGCGEAAASLPRSIGVRADLNQVPRTPMLLEERVTGKNTHTCSTAGLTRNG